MNVAWFVGDCVGTLSTHSSVRVNLKLREVTEWAWLFTVAHNCKHDKVCGEYFFWSRDIERSEANLNVAHFWKVIARLPPGKCLGEMLNVTFLVSREINVHCIFFEVSGDKLIVSEWFPLAWLWVIVFSYSLSLTSFDLFVNAKGLNALWEHSCASWVDYVLKVVFSLFASEDGQFLDGEFVLGARLNSRWVNKLNLEIMCDFSLSWTVGVGSENNWCDSKLDGVLLVNNWETTSAVLEEVILESFKLMISNECSDVSSEFIDFNLTQKLSIGILSCLK